MIEVTTYELAIMFLVVFLLGFACGDMAALVATKQIIFHYKEAIKGYRRLLGCLDD